MSVSSTSNKLSRSPKHSLSPLNSSAQRMSTSGSMPSSPTSIHSSSSAIFERDIQLPLNALHPSPHKDPHHTARAVSHEATDMSVPSVLTSAVLALGETGIDGNGVNSPSRAVSMDDISVVAPSPLSPQNWPSSSLRPTFGSRSPSPTSRQPARPIHRASTGPLPPGGFPSATSSNSASPDHPPSIPLPSFSVSSTFTSEPQPLSLDIPSPSIIGVVPPTPNVNQFVFGSPSPPLSSTPLTPPPGHNDHHVAIPRSNDGSNLSRPTSFAGLSLEELSLAPLMTTTADLPAPLPDQAASGIKSPPSPSLQNNKRLSFISYNDLLLSTPLSSFPLSSVTNPHSNAPATEPPHQVVASSRASLVGVAPPGVSDISPGEKGIHNPIPIRPTHSHDAAGEWVREGLGKGLEERLEAVLKAEKRN